MPLRVDFTLTAEWKREESWIDQAKKRRSNNNNSEITVEKDYSRSIEIVFVCVFSVFYATAAPISALYPV